MRPGGSSDGSIDDIGTSGPRAVAGHRGASGGWLAAAARDRLPPTLRAARWGLDGRAVAVLALLAALVVALAVLALGRSPAAEPLVVPTLALTAAPPAAGLGMSPSATNSPASTTSVVVDVTGLVARPDVYELPGGSRVVDAVEAAGGALEGADLSQLNLARVLVDGEQVAVGVPPAPVPPGGSTGGSSVGDPAAPLDLNSATESELDALPGVGPVLAARIVAWRDANGRFSSVDELLEVSGIGESTLADIAPLVRV